MHYFDPARPRADHHYPDGWPFVVTADGRRQGYMPNLIVELVAMGRWCVRCHVHVGGSAFREISGTMSYENMVELLALYESDPEAALTRIGWTPQMWDEGRATAVRTRRESGGTTLEDLGL